MSKIHQQEEDNISRQIKDRIFLYKKAAKACHRGQSVEQFDSYIQSVYPSMIYTIGEKVYEHLLKLHWGEDKYNEYSRKEKKESKD